MRRFLKNGYALVLLSGVEYGVPFIRMILMTRLLDLRELGIGSALAATYGAVEMVTDIAIYRYVYSAPREEFEEALASAHAVAIVRGAILATLLLCAAPFVAGALSLESDWSSFAWLAFVTLIRSFENYAPKLAERNYQYSAQLWTTLTAAALSLTAMTVVAATTHSHVAIVAMLIGNAIGFVAASRIFADVPYRLRFRSPRFLLAAKFGYPLMFSGLGTSISSQGDRFLVGAMYGMPALGMYSVVILATTLPINWVFRVMGTLNLAIFYNSASIESRFQRNVQLAKNVTAVVACLYAGGVILLTNVVVPLVFGQKFVTSALGVCLLGLGAYVRIVRSEPFGSLMLQRGRTKRLALANIIAASSLGYMVVLAFYWHAIETVFAGRLLGEATSFVFTYFMLRRVFASERRMFSLPILFGLGLAGTACVAVISGWVGHALAPSLIVLAAYFAAIALWGVLILRRFTGTRNKLLPKRS